MSKFVYIAHQLAGNIEENVKEILKICKKVHTQEVMPLAPHLLAAQYLKDHIEEERVLGMAVNKEFFKRKIIDEMWLCGPKISAGMKEEIKLSLEQAIPIRCYNKELQAEFDKLIEQYKKDRN